MGTKKDAVRSNSEVCPTMKGILLAGGLGTRLYPATKAVSKQLIPIYDKPLIYYPLSLLLLSEIREVMIISTPEHLHLYRALFGDGSQLGMEIEYKVQYEPRGIAEAFLLAQDFIGDDSVCLVLGDNLFYGTEMAAKLNRGKQLTKGALMFGYYINNPTQFGVVEFDENHTVVSLEEKPKKPKSNYAVPGLYFYDNTVIDKAKNLELGPRGELEITDLNKMYLQEGNLKVELLGRGFAWLDTGTCEGLADASEFIKTIQKRTNLYVACLEEIAYKKGFISREQAVQLGSELKKTAYGKYILRIAGEVI